MACPDRSRQILVTTDYEKGSQSLRAACKYCTVLLDWIPHYSARNLGILLGFNTVERTCKTCERQYGSVGDIETSAPGLISRANETRLLSNILIKARL
jgi:hypothetical protein